MHAEDLVVDHNAESEEVKHVGEIVPDVGVAIFARAFGVEAIGLGDATRFVVVADEVDAVGVSEFQTYKKGNRFNTEEASIDVIACISCNFESAVRTRPRRTKLEETNGITAGKRHPRSRPRNR